MFVVYFNRFCSCFSVLSSFTDSNLRDDILIQLCTLTILDDPQTTTVEGNETFVVHLDSVQKARLATPHEAVVIINDTLDDGECLFMKGNISARVFISFVLLLVYNILHTISFLHVSSFPVPKFGFLESSVQVKETDGVVSLAVQRDGDISSRASVICYTRQNTASVEQDFTERPLTEMSRIVFEPGQRGQCNDGFQPAISQSNEFTVFK